MLHGIHNHSLESESSAQRSAILFCSLSQLEIDQVKCRNTFLKKIQIDYDNRKQLQGHNQQSYLNLVTLLCQVFRRVRVADGSTIAALCGPILECLSELLEFPTNEGLLVFSKQIQIIGPELKRLKPQELAILLNKLRTCLIHTSRNASVSSQSVASLLLVLEASHSHTWKLSEDEETFYSVNIPTASRMTPMEVSQQQLLQQQQQTQQHHHLQHQLLQQPLDGVLMSDPNLGSSGVSGLLPPHAQLGQKPTDNAGLNDIATRLLATALHQQPTAPAGIIPPPFGGIGPANPAVGIPNLSMPPPGYLSSAHPPGVPNPLLPIVPPAGINGQRNSAGFQVKILRYYYNLLYYCLSMLDCYVYFILRST